VKVIDSSALVKYIVKEPGWRRIEEFISAGCITVDLALKELCNALWKRVMRKELDESLATKLMNTILTRRIVRIYPQEPLLVEALKLSINISLPIYDVIYIVLARKLKSELITSDKEQAEKAEELGVFSILV
jgi:predicted nucleic acid-binding protein